MSNETVLSCENLSKTFIDGELKVSVLSNLKLSVLAGERIAIIGPSGSGKSTFLQILAGLDTSYQGTVSICGHDFRGLSDHKRCKIRNQSLGFIYQFHHLLSEFNALENVMLPVLFSGAPVSKAKELAEKQLELVGLSDRALHKPAQLSGGERQRVAIARAVVNQPKCILADEPTGNLDASTAKHVIQSLLSIEASSTPAVIVVTHDLSLAKQMDCVLRLEKGILLKDVSL